MLCFLSFIFLLIPIYAIGLAFAYFSLLFKHSNVCAMKEQAGGPYYPVFTGRRDSIRSYFQEATAEIPGPDDDLNKILHLFSLRGFSPRETVSLIGTLSMLLPPALVYHRVN